MKKFVDVDTLNAIAKKWIMNNFEFSDDFSEINFYSEFEEFLHEYLYESLFDEGIEDEDVEFELDKEFRFEDLISDYVSDLHDAADYKNPYCG